MTTKTTKKAATRKMDRQVAAKKLDAEFDRRVAAKKAQPEVTPIPKRARGASKVAEAAARRPVPQPPTNAKRVSGPPIPRVHPNGKRYPDPVEQPSIATMTAPDRIKAAKHEHNLLKDWAADGKQGDPPATPILDWLGENPTGSVQRKSQVRKAKAAKNGGVGGGARSSGVCTVRFYANGKEMAASTQKLLDLAWRFTAGLDPAKPNRMTTADFRALLAANGITEPETTEWELTLANGKTVGAKLA